jgi:hypothetical protein
MSRFGGDGSGFSRYIDWDAPIWKRVDFLGMIADFGKGFLVAIVSILAGIVISFQEAILGPFEAGMQGLTMIGGVFARVPAELAEQAFGSAEAQLDLFGVFALPASVSIAVVATTMVAAVIYIFWGL